MTQYELQLVMNMKDSMSNKLKKREQELNDLKRKIDDISSSTKKADSSMASMGKSLSSLNFKANIAMAASFARHIYNMGKAGVFTAAKFETMKATLDAYNRVPLSDKYTRNSKNAKLSDKEWADTEKFANMTPYTTADMIQTMMRLKGAGINPNVNAQKLIAEFAAATPGADPMRVVEALVKAKDTGSLERFEEMGLTKDMVAKRAKKLGLNNPFNKSGSVVNEVSMMKAIESLMAEIGKGQLEAHLDTFNGQLSTSIGLGESLVGTIFGKDAGGNIRQGSILDTMKKKLLDFNDYIGTPKVRTTLESLGAWIGKGLDGAFVKIDELKKRLESAFNTGVLDKDGNLVKGWDGVLEQLKAEWEVFENWMITAIARMINRILEKLREMPLFKDIENKVNSFQNSFIGKLFFKENTPVGVAVEQTQNASLVSRMIGNAKSLFGGKKATNASIADDLAMEAHYQMNKASRIEDVGGVADDVWKYADDVAKQSANASKWSKGWSLLDDGLKSVINGGKMFASFIDDIIRLIPLIGKPISEIFKFVAKWTGLTGKFVFKTLTFWQSELLFESIGWARALYANDGKFNANLWEERKKISGALTMDALLWVSDKLDEYEKSVNSIIPKENNVQQVAPGYNQNGPMIQGVQSPSTGDVKNITINFDNVHINDGTDWNNLKTTLGSRLGLA